MKKTTLIIFMIISLLTLLSLTGCKTEDEAETEAPYDITGTWQVTTAWSSLPAPGTFSIIFDGSATNGIFTTGNDESGTYLVIGNVVQWILSYGAVYTGNFIDETTMQGEMVGSYGATGTWSAVKSTQN